MGLTAPNATAIRRSKGAPMNKLALVLTALLASATAGAQTAKYRHSASTGTGMLKLLWHEAPHPTTSESATVKMLSERLKVAVEGKKWLCLSGPARLGRATIQPCAFREYSMPPLSARPSVSIRFRLEP